MKILVTHGKLIGKLQIKVAWIRNQKCFKIDAKNI